MTKYLILAAVIYLVYRFSSAPKISSTSTEKEKESEEEYTDYEEIE